MAAGCSELPKINKFAGEAIGADNVLTVFAGDDTGQQSESRFVLLLSPENSGKAAFIDGICNVCYGCTFDSQARFKIANERFDAMTPNKNVTKYVFNSSKFPFQPVIIDTPEIGMQQETVKPGDFAQLVRNYFTSDPEAVVHAIVVLLPGRSSALAWDVQSAIIQTLALFPSRDSIITVANFLSSESDLNVSLLRQLGLEQSKRFIIDTLGLFALPDPEWSQRVEQRRVWEAMTQTLITLLLFASRLNPQKARNRHVPAPQNRPLLIPQTIPEVKEDSSLGSPSTTSVQSATLPMKQKPVVIGRSTSFTDMDRQVAPKRMGLNQPLPTTKTVIYGSQPLGPEIIPVEATLLPGSNQDFGAVKRYLYDPSTRTYQMYYVRDCFSDLSGSLTMPVVPRVISPISDYKRPPVRQEMARLLRSPAFEPCEGSPTTDSEPSSQNVNQFKRGGTESLRSTGSDWKFTPIRHMQGQTVIPMPSAPVVTRIETDINEPGMPSKPVHAVDPAYVGGEAAEYRRTVRQSKRGPSRRPLKSRHNFAVGAPEWEESDDEEPYPAHVPLRSPRPRGLMPSGQRPPIKAGWGNGASKRFSYPPQAGVRAGGPQPPPRRFRRGPGARRPPSVSSRSVAYEEDPKEWDCTKCCFYVLAPLFLLLVVVAVVVTLVVSGTFE